jgi:hypothetical protein
MMELFIHIKDGQPFNHPILSDNFRVAFPDIDTNNLPPEFARFERVEPPTLDVYEVYEGVRYEWEGNIIKDIHHVRAMTTEEKTAKQYAVKQMFPNYEEEGYLFDEETCSFIPKITIGITHV